MAKKRNSKKLFEGKDRFNLLQHRIFENALKVAIKGKKYPKKSRANLALRY